MIVNYPWLTKIMDVKITNAALTGTSPQGEASLITLIIVKTL